jgi:hypothetical protein
VFPRFFLRKSPRRLWSGRPTSTLRAKENGKTGRAGITEVRHEKRVRSSAERTLFHL